MLSLELLREHHARDLGRSLRVTKKATFEVRTGNCLEIYSEQLSVLLAA